MKDLIVLTGPTAVGKTSLSIALAKAVDGEIISADSMQVYKYLNIGTAKITEEEKCGIPHFLIDELEPDEEFNVTIFKNKVMGYIEDIKSRGKVPIIVGGTGFYIQSVIYDINFNEYGDDSKVRKKYEAMAETLGKSELHKKLALVDREYADSVSYNNVKKVVRALTFFEMTGEKLSEHNKRERERSSPFDFAYFVLTMDRKKLYERIDKRVDLMFDMGLVEEVKALMAKGYDKSLVSMQGIGYKEVIDYLSGKTSLEECIDIIKRDTRHFAKRQLTWFKREKVVTYIDKDEFDAEDKCLKEMLRVYNS
ncbi:tRNA (adenosine(37)-N6)-dimethylallyltransferase MiaA [Catonella massiliensis]|uniref:tRNA dimethylallyltransferase n=1 Tax=Catonella massiliensis TaxID=2799636 RepID=A0ABS1IZ09_9FIRM|nr:tRNA (adenosine(37)-N6)-dimethylallyltransferase MiaA [Catonella massiliensis]MBK5897127.1 tRNA (adenosine(37)-N6)-dimethylallyltransferase MiaA [Catonella massiliensis]